MKRQFSTRHLFSIMLIVFSSLFVILFAGIAYLGVSRVVTQLSTARFDDYQKLFVDTITPDLLLGKESEVFRKCIIQKDRSEVSFIRIRMNTGQEICSFTNAGNSDYKFVNSIYYDSQRTSKLATIEMAFADNASSILKYSLLRNAVMSMAIILIFALLLTRHFLRPYVETLTSIATKLENPSLGHMQFLPHEFPETRSSELNLLLERLSEMSEGLRKAKTVEIEFERQRALSDLASQVSHDIRSPLAALTMAVEHMASKPDDMRSIIKSATHRITSIANSLLERGKILGSQVLDSNVDTLPIKITVQSLVAEKQLELSGLPQVEIQFREDTSNEFFSQVDESSLKQCLSNIINNAVESLGQRGTVVVAVESAETNIRISVTDNGVGIPSDVLKKLLEGKERVTFGKSNSTSGSGLGILHARKVVERFGGRLEISTEIGQGTTVTLIFPSTEKPQWLQEALPLDISDQVIIVDDDQLIHDTWAIKFQGSKFTHADDSLINVRSSREFEALMANKKSWRDILFLMDLELSTSGLSGLDLIEKYGIRDQSVLVTGRYNDVGIQQRCLKLGIRILPKTMIEKVRVQKIV